MDQVKSQDQPINAFTFKLLKELSGSEINTNLVCSPFSVSSAMSMVLHGANGKTKAELEDTLVITKSGPCGATASKLLHVLSANDNLAIANKVFTEKTFNVKKKFISDVQEYNKSEVQTVDFQHEPEGSRKQINDWVVDKTKGKIKDLLQPGTITTETRLVIANAIHFKADWADQFEKSNTTKRKFNTVLGKNVDVDMMTRKAKYRYGADSSGSTRMVEIPYEGNALSMLILLPNDITEAVKNLDAQAFARLYKSMDKEEVVLGLPKFKLEFEKDLVQSFRNLGTKEIFTGGADLSGIAESRDVFVSAIAHKAFIEVDEEGTEAAAATAIVMRRMMLPLPPVEFICDKPFLFFIIHKATEAILFVGSMMNPTQV